MLINGNVKRNKYIIVLIFVAAIFIAATFSESKICYASQDSQYDDAASFTNYDTENIIVPLDVTWQDRTISDKDEKGRTIKYVLNDKRVKVYVDGVFIWASSDRYLVQDIFVANIESENKKSDNARIRNNSEKELVLLLWKKGRYGIHKPFWIVNDEEQFSQHIFTYNVVGNKVKSKWGSSYIGKEAKSFLFDNNILFLTYKDDTESAWKWISFGFEEIEPVKFLVAGDNLIHDYIYKDALNNHGGDFEYIYKKAEKYTKEADFSIINLETPLVKDAKMYSTYPCFGSPVMVAEGIKKAGFDAVTLSNNHRLDKGVTGIVETLETLDENNLLHVGSMDEKPYLLIKRNDIVFALLSYTYGTNGIRTPKGYENAVNLLDDEDKVRVDIREAKANSDMVIVFPHWGTEYAKEPDYYEKKWRDIFYEEGVDAVMGTHPHVKQKYEMYSLDGNNHNMLIYYSLGNYISGNQNPDRNSGGLALFDVNITSKGPVISNYDFVEIDTIYSARKY